MAKTEKKPVEAEIVSHAVPEQATPAEAQEQPTSWEVKPNIPVTIIAGDELLFHGAGLKGVHIELRGE